MVEVLSPLGSLLSYPRILIAEELRYGYRPHEDAVPLQARVLAFLDALMITLPASGSTTNARHLYGSTVPFVLPSEPQSNITISCGGAVSIMLANLSSACFVSVSSSLLRYPRPGSSGSRIPLPMRSGQSLLSPLCASDMHTCITSHVGRDLMYYVLRARRVTKPRSLHL